MVRDQQLLCPGGIANQRLERRNDYGAKNYIKRELGKLLKLVPKGYLIICAKLSRLGHNLFMIMEILNLCKIWECRVWTIKDGYRLGDDIQSKVLAFVFGLSAEIERNLIRQRTKEALARKRAEGIVLGRPKGSKTRPELLKLHKRTSLIREMMRLGHSRRQIARVCKVHRNTLARYIRNFIDPQVYPLPHAQPEPEDWNFPKRYQTTGQ